MRIIGIILLFLSFWQVDLFSSNQLKTTRMEVRLDNPAAPIGVLLSCMVTIDSIADQIPVRLISQEGVAIQRVKVMIQGEEYPLTLTPINSKVAQGEIRGRFEGDANNLLEIVITYELPANVFKKNATTVTIPLVFIDWKPDAASAEAFTSTVSVRETYAVQSIFPAMQWTKETKGSYNTYSFDLQTIPAWVKFKLYQGSLPFISLELMVDLGVILTLVILMFVGWRKFRNGKN